VIQPIGDRERNLIDLTRRGAIRLAGAAGLVAATGAVLTASPAQAAQSGWRWCRQCRGLWFAGNGTGGVCPAGGEHSFSGSGDYHIDVD
jgi:hypothetical protein